MRTKWGRSEMRIPKRNTTHSSFQILNCESSSISGNKNKTTQTGKRHKEPQDDEEICTSERKQDSTRSWTT